MGSKNKRPHERFAPLGDDVVQPPFETHELRKGIEELFGRDIESPADGSVHRLGSLKGVYVFFDYDGEPIYVGQTHEGLATRVRRHLTNQRTDAVAMSVLDPFEVCDVELYPLFPSDTEQMNAQELRAHLDALEAAVYNQVLEASHFRAVLNEKVPAAEAADTLPAAVRGRITSPEVLELRSHPDVRLARRAATLARLAQIISERKVQPGLRRVLQVQAQRLENLASRRYSPFQGASDAAEED